MRRRVFLKGLGFGGAALGLAPEWGVAARRASAAPPRRGSPSASLATALSARAVTLGVRLTRFDQSHVAATSAVALPATTASAKLVLDGTTVTCRSRVVPARDRADASDIEITFRVLRGRVPNGGLALTLSFARWSRDVYLLIPGAVYGGNRFASRHIPFPPLLSEPSDIGPHVPPIITDVPRLNNQAGESSIALGALDTAVPTMGVRLPGSGPDSGLGLLLLAEPITSIGPTGLGIVENTDRSAAMLTIGAPSVRPDVRYALCNGRVASTDRGADLEVGAKVVLRVRVLPFACPDVQTLFDRWFESRRDGVGPATLAHGLPLSAGRRLIEERLLHDPSADVPGVVTARPAAGAGNGQPGDARPEPTFRTGADGALALTPPILMSGAAGARQRGAATLDFQLRGRAPSGFFHAASNGSSWWDEGDASSGSSGGEGRGSRSRRWTHIGRNAEALHLACRQVQLLARMESSFQLPDAWRTGLTRAADAFVKLWNRHGQLGQYVSTETGDVAIGGSTAGALAPAALVAAARVLEADDVYLRVANAIAEALYGRFVRAGLTLGGAPAALQCPDSRSAAGLLESFVTLGETTGDSMWFTRAAEIAHQAATWIVAWDAPLPEESTLGKLGVHTTGAVLTSAQDKWALPGFAGLSGDALFRLYRATGRVAYLELLRETIHNSTGYIATDDRRPDAETPPGWVTGRIPIGDALGSRGEVPIATPAGTAQASCLLAATEIPSIYVQPDTGFVFVFDHVDVRLTERTPAHTKLSVHNPTRFEAELRIFSEPDSQRTAPLDPFPLWGARTLTLDAGATDELEFARPSS